MDLSTGQTTSGQCACHSPSAKESDATNEKQRVRHDSGNNACVQFPRVTSNAILHANALRLAEKDTDNDSKWMNKMAYRDNPWRYLSPRDYLVPYSPSRIEPGVRVSASFQIFSTAIIFGEISQGVEVLIKLLESGLTAITIHTNIIKVMVSQNGEHIEIRAAIGRKNTPRSSYDAVSRAQ